VIRNANISRKYIILYTCNFINIFTGLKRKSNATKDGSTCSKLSLLSKGERIPGKVHHQGHTSERTNQTQANELASDRAAFLFSSGKKDRSLSKEFAQEFHESVLQTTRQKELNSRLGTSIHLLLCSYKCRKVWRHGIHILCQRNVKVLLYLDVKSSNTAVVKFVVANKSTSYV